MTARARWQVSAVTTGEHRVERKTGGVCAQQLTCSVHAEYFADEGKHEWLGQVWMVKGTGFVAGWLMGRRRN